MTAVEVREENKSNASCCPPGSHGFLKQTGATAGSLFQANFYKTGKGTKCLIVFPDVWGWNSGRTRLLADTWAKSLNCVAIVPKVQTPFKYGTDGDGLPPDFEINDKTMPDLFGMVKTNTWEVIQPQMDDIMRLMRKQGCTKFAVAGFCWGGWAAFHTAARYPGEFCAVGIAHPSIHLEEAAFGKDLGKLTESVECPVLLMLADGDDPKFYGPEGTVFSVLKKKKFFSKCKTTHYEGMAHGWMTRGDESDEKTAACVKKGMKMLTNHFASNGFGPDDNGPAPETPAPAAADGGCCML